MQFYFFIIVFQKLCESLFFTKAKIHIFKIFSFKFFFHRSANYIGKYQGGLKKSLNLISFDCFYLKSHVQFFKCFNKLLLYIILKLCALKMYRLQLALHSESTRNNTELSTMSLLHGKFHPTPTQGMLYSKCISF